jgi:predicted alpha/beta superfamily hydrolase
MNFPKIWLCLLAICYSASASATATVTGGSSQVVIGQIHGIESSVLNEKRNYRVSLPDSYRWAKNRRYPVLYVLDGESNFFHTAASVSFLSARGEIPEMVVVGVDSTVRVRDYTQTDWPQAWVGGGGAGNFKRFMSAELIPAIENNYRTDGFRLLSGHSAAGQYALYCLSSEPSLFRAYIALSPSLDWDHNLPQRALEKSFASTRKLEAFLYVARSDDAGRPLADYKRLVQTLKEKSPKGLRWFSQAFPKETHSGVPLLAQIDALRHVYQGYRFHNDMMSKGFAYAEQHFQRVSKTVGWPLGVPEGVINEFAYEALSQGRTPAAVALFNRNVQANPNSANAWDGLADAYAKLGQWKNAVEASEKAVALATEFANPNLPYLVGQARKMNERLQQGDAPTK